MKRFSPLCLDRMLPTPQRSPRLKLFDILQHYHARTYQSCPAAGNPRQTANKLVLWLPALCFAEMLTIWRKPRQRHRMPATYFDRIYLPHILAVMLRVWMICFVHLDGFRIMVDCNVYTIPRCLLDSSTCPASTGKVVYNQLSVNHFCKTSFPPPSTSRRRPPRLLPSNCKNHQIRSSSIFYHALSRSSYRPLLNMQNNNSTIDRFRRPPKHLMAIASFHLSRFPSSGVGF